MKSFIRITLFAVALLGLAPVLAPAEPGEQLGQPQPFAGSLEERVANLELKFRVLDTVPQQIAELSAKLDKLVDPLTQAPLRAAPAAAPVLAAPSTLKRLSNGMMVECDDNGCKIISQNGLVVGRQCGDQYTSYQTGCNSAFASQSASYSAPVRAGPLRRLFGRR